MVVDTGGEKVFLLLPRALLEKDSCGVVNLDLLAIGRTLEWVRVEGGKDPSKTILPMGGRLLLKGTTSEQVSEESPPFLADLGLAEPFLHGTRMFITFTFFSQPAR